MKKNITYFMVLVKSVILASLLTLYSCNKLVEVQPPVTSVTNENVFTSDANAISALTQHYADMAIQTSVYNSSVYLGLYTDELKSVSSTGTASLYYLDKLSTGLNNTGAGFELWNSFYRYIYWANEQIAGISASAKLSALVKQQLLGEAKFMRAFYYFQLTNLYGDLPLILITDYKINSQAARVPQSQIYAQIKADLLDAQSLLSKNFPDGTLLNISSERLRPTYWAATALLARYYLYTGDWTNAEAQASILIRNTAVFTLSSFDNAFKKASLGNNEAIWQLQTTNAANGTPDADSFVLSAAPDANSVILNDALVNSFESGDLRKVNWVGSVTYSGITYYFPNKYKVKGFNPSADEYVVLFRLAEQYLIRAEARAHNNKLTGPGSAAEDINVIRSRAGLAPTTATTPDDLLKAVYHERQVELFSEQGHRWFDLKRTGLANTMMPGIASAKGGSWNANKLLFPLPYNDLLNDRNLKQNPGY